MAKNYRVVTRGVDGSIKIRDYDEAEPLLKMHSQIGIEDSSTDLSLRGQPVFRGLIGPMPDGKGVVRYESPEVFESLTKDWASAKAVRRTRRRRHSCRRCFPRIRRRNCPHSRHRRFQRDSYRTRSSLHSLQAVSRTRSRFRVTRTR